LHSALVIAGLFIASMVRQLASPPIAFQWRAHDAAIEAVSVSPDGVPAAVWCEELHGSGARCFAQLADRGPLAILRGGAIDAADSELQPPFRGVRHFSMTGARIDWNDGVPIFLIACHTGALTGICEQQLGDAPAFVGTAHSPLDAHVARVGSTAVWSDVEGSRTVFRTANRTIGVCSDEATSYAIVPLGAAPSALIYTDTRTAQLRAAIVAPDLTIERETVLANDVHSPGRIAAASARARLFVVWSGGGVFALRDGAVIKLSDSGNTPAIATDGSRVVVVWLERGAVMMAELSRSDLPRSLIALGAADARPFLALNSSPKTGFISHWRAQSPGDRIVIASRAIP
jgi:hypothetical protein